MKLPRLSRRQQAGFAVALALLLWLPQGVSTHEHTVVTGHSTFYNASGYDPCLASVAGILRTRVMWFNDMVLAERYGGKGTFIYLTEHGAEDPTAKSQLYTEGVYYDFVDPNGAHWHVEEAFMWENVTYDVKTPDANGKLPVPSAGNGGASTGGADSYVSGASATVGQERTYVWVVELAQTPIYDDFAGSDPHEMYNFLLMVDTCKMMRARHGEVWHNNTATMTLGPDNGHPVGADNHMHNATLANLWIGKRPLLVPLGGASTTPSSWQSSWTTSYPDQQASGANLTAQTNDGPSNRVTPDGNRTSYDE